MKKILLTLFCLLVTSQWLAAGLLDAPVPPIARTNRTPAQLVSALSGQTIAPAASANTVAIFEGDSLTAPLSYGWVAQITNSPWWGALQYTNAAVGGNTLADVTNRWVAWEHTVPPTNGQWGLYSLRIGANEVYSDSAKNFITALSNFVALVASSNWHVVGWTVMPRGDFDTPKARTNLFQVNNWIRQSSLFWRVVDAAEKTPNCYDPAFFNADHVHHVAAGYAMDAAEMAYQVSLPSRSFGPPRFATESGTNFIIATPGATQPLAVWGPEQMMLGGDLVLNGNVILNGGAVYGSLSGGSNYQAAVWWPTNGAPIAAWWDSDFYQSATATNTLPSFALPSLALTNIGNGVQGLLPGAVNGHSALCMTNTGMFTPPYHSTNFLEVFAVLSIADISVTNTASNSSHIFSDAAGAWFQFNMFGTVFSIYTLNPNVFFAVWSAPIVNQYFLLDVTIDGNTSRALTNNGTAGLGSLSTTNVTDSGFELGHDRMTWYFAEGMVFTNRLSLADHASAVTYFQARYGLTNIPTSVSGVTGSGSAIATTNGSGVVNISVTGTGGDVAAAGNTHFTGSNSFAGNTTFELPPVGSGAGLTNVPATALQANSVGSNQLSTIITAQLGGSSSVVVQGTNGIQVLTNGGAYTVSYTNASGGVAVAAGTNATAVTNAGVVTVAAVVSHTEVSAATNGLGSAAFTASTAYDASGAATGATNGLGAAAWSATSAFDASGAALNATGGLSGAIIVSKIGGTAVTTATGAVNATNVWGTLVQSNLTLATITNNTSGKATTAGTADTALAGWPTTWAESAVTGLVGDLASKQATNANLDGWKGINTNATVPITVAQASHATNADVASYVSGTLSNNITGNAASATTVLALGVPVEQWGATGNGIEITNCWLASGTNRLFSTNVIASFSAGDVGKVIGIWGAGAAGGYLHSYITQFVAGAASTAILISNNASATVANGSVIYGTDDTLAFQAALNQITNGSYVLYCAARGYIIDGPLQDPGGATHKNSQLVLPDVPKGEIWGPTITINGKENPAQVFVGSGGEVRWDNPGTTLFSTLSPTSCGGSFFNPMNAATSAHPYFNPVCVRWKNISIQLPPNPQVSALAMGWAANAVVENVGIQCGFPEFGTSPQPTCGTSVGLQMPFENNAGSGISRINGCYVYGFNTCYQISEHDTLIQGCAVQGNTAIQFAPNGAQNHSILVVDFNSEGCKTNFSAANACHVMIERAAMEHDSGGWLSTVWDVYDPSHSISGEIHWTTVVQNVGDTSDWKETKGTNLITARYGLTPDAYYTGSFAGDGRAITNAGNSAYQSNTDLTNHNSLMTTPAGSISTNLCTIVLNTNFGAMIKGMIVANSAYSNAGWELTGLFWNSNGVITQVGGATNKYPTSATWEAGFETSGSTNVLIRGFGDAAAPVQWGAHYELLSITNGSPIVAGPSNSQAPSNQPNNLLYYNADTLSGSPVSSWADISTNLIHYNLTQGNVPYQPAILAADINGHNALSFIGSAKSTLTNTALPNTAQPIQVFAVLAITNATSDWAVMWCLAQSGNHGLTAYDAPNNRFVEDYGNTTTSSGFKTTNSYILVEQMVSGANSVLRTNNVTCSATNNVGTSYGISTIVLAQDFTRGQVAYMRLAELAVFSPPLSDTTSIIHYYKTNYPSLNLP